MRTRTTPRVLARTLAWLRVEAKRWAAEGRPRTRWRRDWEAHDVAATILDAVAGEALAREASGGAGRAGNA